MKDPIPVPNGPDRKDPTLADWLAARQLFVALIVTAEVLFANRSVIVVAGFMHRVGVSLPGEWTADVVEDRS